MEVPSTSLFQGLPKDHVIVRRGTQPVSVGEFLTEAANLGASLVDGMPVINLCDDRHAFLVLMAGALSRGCTSLLPASRAVDIVDEVARAWPGAQRVDDASGGVKGGSVTTPYRMPDPGVTALIGFTSGSTGVPTAHPKSLRSLALSTERNAAALRHAIGDPAAFPGIVATVPPQHMYGIEMSVFLPLFAGFPVHARRPLFPADIADALRDMPRPRILVSTPVHLVALVDSGISLPPIDLVVSATAPLDQAHAAWIEEFTGARLLELFGSTETCVIASRRTALEAAWTPMAGVRVESVTEGSRVFAPWFDEPVLLQDHFVHDPDGRLCLVGRASDLIDIAGKRASLADLTARLRGLRGVLDAVFLLPEDKTGRRVARLAAFAVAPTRTEADLLDELRRSCDAAFLPRPLMLVDRLPRNASGKLERSALLAMLAQR